MISRELSFYCLLDFFPKRQKLKEEYDKLSIDEKYIYKMYVYSLPFEDENHKDLMWEYLNGWEESKFDLSLKYMQMKRRNENRRKYEMRHKY